ncbi:response regulator [Puniceicoccus vermicola]|uniref:Response regulator n=1 Tax=Puniceicoccus vermicola TaxID=388746 RepID=A0A7X1B0D7_9BACT|nr:response regulator [Puniceicoccus vermicola]MBC2602233.1 response regulator [Puniceicoccus vermicola]
MNVLIIDDEENVLAVTALIVRTTGHRAYTAYNPQQADQILTEKKVHAIILDRMLGKTDGLDYMEELQARGSQIPVVIFTAHMSPNILPEAKRRGARHFIQKPFRPDQIRKTIRLVEKEHWGE